MSNYNVATSSELMENYLQADILLPQNKFQALQTDAGTSLLFSIATNGVFKLTMEMSGQSHGWRSVDLSTAQAHRDFPKGATCCNFTVAQVPHTLSNPATISLLMILNDGANDYLYLSLGNSDSDLDWIKAPIWIEAPFNVVNLEGHAIPAPSPLKIAQAFIGEASDMQYIVVDLIKNPDEPVGDIARYYIDTSTPSVPKWKPHDIAFDIQAEGYDSCLGRAVQALGVDGLYTKGKINGTPQLVYTPLYNVFDPKVPAAPARLYLPNGLAANAFNALRNADNTSDLFVAAEGSLYRFVSTNQHDCATGIQIAASSLLSGVRDLYVYSNDNGGVTVWGLNGSDQVFYFEFDSSGAPTSAPPIPILTGVDAISPYIDRQFKANTFFAHTNNGLIKLVKTPSTGMWSRSNITLPPSDVKQDAKLISSYTTHIAVTDASGQPVSDIAVSLTAVTVTSVLINHLYYIVGPQPIEVRTDSLGTVTIIELARNLSATRLTVMIGEQTVPEINPMDAPFKRNTQYDSSDKLKAAVITERDGSTRPFIPASTSDDDLKKVAASNQGLNKAYDNLSQKKTTTPPKVALYKQHRPVPYSLVSAGYGHSIFSDIGDLFSWLESGVEAAIEVIEDVAEKVWHFVARIGDAIYYGILDCVEAVVSAVLWVYNAIKVVIEDIIKFLEFLFAWKDILTTHRVIKNVILQFTKQAIDGMSNSKETIATAFIGLETVITKWAGVQGLNQTMSTNAKANPTPAGQNSAPANLGMHHFQGNCANVQSLAASLNPGDNIFMDLVALLDNEEETIFATFSEIQTQIIEQLGTLSISDIIKRVLAILADFILNSTENILNAVLDVLMQLTTGLIDVVSTSIDIPVLSWLYHLLTGDDLSFLDLVCLLAAIPVTLVYKETADSPPFPHNDAYTEKLINAGSFVEIKALFVQPPTLELEGGALAEVSMVSLSATPVLDEDRLKTFAAVFGITSLVGSGVLVVVSAIQKGADASGIKLNNNKTLETIACFGNIAYVSPNLSTLINVRSGTPYGDLNNALTGISIVKSMVKIKWADTENKKILETFSAIETVINIVWNVPVIENIIINQDAVNSSYKSLVPESIGNFCFNIGGMMEWPIYRLPNVELMITQSGMMLAYGLLMGIAGSIYRWAPNQYHAPLPPMR